MCYLTFHIQKLYLWAINNKWAKLILFEQKKTAEFI